MEKISGINFFVTNCFFKMCILLERFFWMQEQWLCYDGGLQKILLDVSCLRPNIGWLSSARDQVAVGAAAEGRSWHPCIPACGAQSAPFCHRQAASQLCKLINWSSSLLYKAAFKQPMQRCVAWALCI